jgi:hypothetical protein
LQLVFKNGGVVLPMQTVRALERAVDVMLASGGSVQGLAFAEAKEMVLAYFDGVGDGRVCGFIRSGLLPNSSRVFALWLNCRAHPESPIVDVSMSGWERLELRYAEPAEGLTLRFVLVNLSGMGRPMDFQLHSLAERSDVTKFLTQHFPLPGCIVREL